MSGDRRFEKLAPSSLDAAQREVYEAVVRGPRSRGPQSFRLVDENGGLEGPFNGFLLQPGVGMPLQALGAAIRCGVELSARGREVAILVVAAHWKSDFEWYAHAAVGEELGIDKQELAAIRDGRHDILGPDASLVARLAYALVDNGDLDDALYFEGVDALGPAGVFELTTLVGYYTMLAMQLRVFRVGAPDQDMDCQ